MQEYLIHQSIEGTGCEAPWNNYIFNSIAWQPLSEFFRILSSGQCIQFSKYMNDLRPIERRLQTFHNRHDGHCFICGLCSLPQHCKTWLVSSQSNPQTKHQPSWVLSNVWRRQAVGSRSFIYLESWVRYPVEYLQKTSWSGFQAIESKM
jgi:hypothetical protein